MNACEATAPTPVLMCGTIAPTAKKRVATTMPMRPVGSSRAMIDQVTASPPGAACRPHGSRRQPPPGRAVNVARDLDPACSRRDSGYDTLLPDLVPWRSRTTPMLTYLALKYLHVIGAAVLLGTGAGIAFFMLLAHRTGDAATVAAVARIVVVADVLFTATAVVAQPITGTLLAWIVGYSLLDGWLLLSIALYFVTGAFWLPVVWMQMRMRDLAATAAREGTAPARRIPPPVPPLVRLRLPGLRGRAGYLLADDRQAAARLSSFAPPCQQTLLPHCSETGQMGGALGSLFWAPRYSRAPPLSSNWCNSATASTELGPAACLIARLKS